MLFASLRARHSRPAARVRREATGTHHYHFPLLAVIGSTLDLIPSASAADLVQTARPYVIQEAEPTGTYQR